MFDRGSNCLCAGLAAKGLHNAGWSYRLMTANPWMVLGLGLVASVGTMLGTRMTDPDKSVFTLILFYKPY